MNGVNGATGDYALPDVDLAAIAEFARGDRPLAHELAAARSRVRTDTERMLGVAGGVDAADLAEAGWGLILAHDAEPALLDALAELVTHRRSIAATKDERRFRVFAGPDGYQPNDTSSTFLARHGAAPGQAAEPNRVPYYLLIVGTPEAIPFRFQYDLDVVYAVGRLDFEALDDYARYAAGVVAAERGEPRAKRLVLAGPRNRDDQATTMSAGQLLRPLGPAVGNDRPAWQVDSLGEEAATKSRLLELLDGRDTPSVLMTASHGMAFPAEDPRQRPHQGGLLAQDWPGRLEWGDRPIPPDFYVAADDIPDTAQLGGLVAILFACYSAGTPHRNDFPGGETEPPAPFVAALPQRLLRQGALAVVGHVERAWSLSFMWPGTSGQIGTFASVLGALLDGARIGFAMEYFNQRYAALSVQLEEERDAVKYGKPADAMLMAGLWTAKADTRNFALFGDPATHVVS